MNTLYCSVADLKPSIRRRDERYCCDQTIDDSMYIVSSDTLHKVWDLRNGELLTLGNFFRQFCFSVRKTMWPFK